MDRLFATLTFIGLIFYGAVAMAETVPIEHELDIDAWDELPRDLGDKIPLNPNPALPKGIKANRDEIVVATIPFGSDMILVAGYGAHHVCGTAWYASLASTPAQQISLGCADDNPTVLTTATQIKLVSVWTHESPLKAWSMSHIFDGKTWITGDKTCADYVVETGSYSPTACK